MDIQTQIQGKTNIKPIEVTKLVRTCDVCPSQWDGITKDNRQVYIRFRCGHLTIQISEPNDMSEDAAAKGLMVLDLQSADVSLGRIGFSELNLLMPDFIHLPPGESQVVDWWVRT